MVPETGSRPIDLIMGPAFATVAHRVSFVWCLLYLVTCRYELGVLEVGPSHQRLLEGNARQVLAVVIRVLDVYPTRNGFSRSCSNNTKQFRDGFKSRPQAKAGALKTVSDFIALVYVGDYYILLLCPNVQLMPLKLQEAPGIQSQQASPDKDGRRA